MTLKNLQSECISLLCSTFGKTDDKIVASFAPGRVNLIGEHTDYNNGYVFPMALSDLGTIVVGRKSAGKVTNIVTAADVVPSQFIFTPDVSLIEEIPQWGRYVVGVIKKFEELTNTDVCVTISIVSNLPLGAGLSSSASLEVAVFSFLEHLYGVKNISKIDKIKACQGAEHTYAGVPCGIMDQFIATLGERNKALFINCETDDYEIVPFGDATLQLVVTDTHKKHELASGEYAKRRATCEAVSQSIGVKSLADVSFDQLIKHFSVPGSQLVLPDKSYARARHVVTEIARAKAARACLSAGDFITFGRLMNNSHKSLCDDYQVTCTELDEVVQVAWGIEGVLGSRMTGGGFGGCAITLVKTTAADTLLEQLNKKCPYSSSFCTTAGEGARAWDV